MTPTPSEILQKYWGYSSFRPLQSEIISSVLEGKDSLALLPTGGGKSICFQVPALCREGLCLVITPLVALMHDQVENLSKRGIPAVEVHSGMHSREISLAFEKCADGRAKFLYVSPERLDTEAFRNVAPYLDVRLIAVDEAHCISQWGYDFRPPYLRIANIRPLFPKAPVIALTATAVTKVVADIQEKLLFTGKNVFRKSFKRDNLAYLVYKEEDKYRKLLRICNGVNGPGIIYVRNRRLTRETAEYLERNGVKAGFYHAGLDTITRTVRQRDWMSEKIRVIVATNAFGMGIDKPNVRFVVHLDLPENLEAYFQEAGRAGRDEKKSFAVILYHESDILDARHFLELAWPEPEVIRQVYLALGNYFQLPVGSGRDISFNFDLEAFSANYRLKPVIVFNSLKILEREGFIALSDAIDEPSRVLFTTGRDELYKYQVENHEADRLIKVLLRSYSGLFTDFVRVHEHEIARRMGAEWEFVVQQLDSLKKAGMIEYIPQKKLPQLTFVCERLAPENLGLSQTYYFGRKKEAAVKLEQLIGYVTSTEECRNISLLNYFGDDTGRSCGICDVCLERKRSGLSEEEFERISRQVEGVLSDSALSIADLVKALPGFREEKVLKVIRWMADNQRLTHDGEFFSLK